MTAATATKPTKKKAVEKAVNGTTKAKHFVDLDLHMLRSNDAQPRQKGVISNLNDEGYGLFSQEEELVNPKKLMNEDGTPKRCLWDMLMSDKPEDWAFACGLIDENEPEIVELANDIFANGQLEPIGIYPVDIKDLSKGWEVVYGACRSIAKAYLYARSIGELPCTIQAKIQQDVNNKMDLIFRAMSENRGRRGESLIDEAKNIQRLKKMGMTLPDIAEQRGTQQANIRKYLKLLRLTPEEQMRVHTGKLKMAKAVALIDERDKGATPAVDGGAATASDNEPSERKRMPSVKQAQTNYAALEKPEGMDDVEWGFWVSNDVRKFVAYYLKIEYKSHRDMVNEAKKLEKDRLQQEALRQAAEAAAADEPAEEVA